MNPTSPFTTSGPENRDIGEFYVVQDRRATDLEVVKGRSGSRFLYVESVLIHHHFAKKRRISVDR